MKKVTRLFLGLLLGICLFSAGNIVKAEENAAIDLVDGKTFNSIVSKAIEGKNVDSIVFKNGTLPGDGIDLSADKSGSIKGIVEGTSFVIYAAPGNTIKFNENVDMMFAGLTDDKVETPFAYIKSIDFGTSVIDTSATLRLSDVFYGASSLEKLDLSQWNTSSATSLHHIFNGCSSLTQITFGDNFDTSKVTNMEEMFQGCSSLESLDLSKFDTTSVKYMNGMFNKCDSLTSLDLSNFNTENVTDMGRMFARCHFLSTIKFGDKFVTKNVEDMSNMFAQDASLTSLDLSSFGSIDNLKNSSEMFKGCAFLSRIYTSSGLDFGKVASTGNMFLGCANLVGGKGTEVDLYHLDGEYGHVDGVDSKPGYFSLKDDCFDAVISPETDGYFYSNGIQVKGISHDNNGVVTMDGLNVDSKVNDDLTLVLPSNTKEIKVLGTNNIVNIADNNDYLILSANNVKFTGDGDLTVLNVNGQKTLSVVETLTINGPTLNIFSNVLGLDDNASLTTNRLVINSGTLNTLGTIGINLVETDKRPSLVINGGNIDAYGTYTGLMEVLKTNNKVGIYANAVGRTLLVEDLNSAHLKRIKDSTNAPYYFAYYVNDELARLVILTKVIPTPDPQPKDESCEKVIGPTWHWNNDKGICEDYGVVGTYTR